MKVKVESEKVGLKLNIQKTKIMVSGPITSWEIEGLTVNTMSNFFLIYFLGVVLVLFFRFYFIYLLYNILLVLPYINMNLPQQIVIAAMKSKDAYSLEGKL